ncbi:MAG: LCP family protein [Chloroflexi bacterium]|jgi:LCP family protein required for cell wall assembly|nr:LCP family protein [Chloroflexota bacterium]
MQRPQRKSSLPAVLFLLVLILGLALGAAVSLNRVRDGEGSFLNNLWTKNGEGIQDPFLAGNSNSLQIPPHVKTIMLLGSDYTPQSGYRTDVMLLAAFNTKTNEIHLFSLPRDLWVDIPGYYAQRLNVAHAVGGYQLLGDTLAYNFGFRPDHYAIAEFSAFQYVVDLLGGINVQVTERMEDQCDFTPERWCVVEPGLHEMDSHFALWYVRARLNSSDFDRTRRAQEVARAIAKKITSPANLVRLPTFIESALDVVETDMTIGDMWLYIMPLNKFLKPDIATGFTLTPNEAVGFITDDGAMVLQPDYGAIQNILREVFWID